MSVALVIGATGQQGGATARHLLRRGWQVRALVRDPSSPAAARLTGAELVVGDLDDPASLERAMRGADAVFSMQALAYEPETLKAEVRQGMRVADVALDAEVGHLVYSSVGGAERHTGIEHFESKAAIEAYIRALGLPATILRPVFFMDNLLHYADADADAGGERLMELPVLPYRPMQLIATDDIGRIAAQVIDHRDDYLGVELEIAGDELTFAEVAGIYERVTGVPTRLVPLPLKERLFEWFAESGYHADLAKLRKDFPGLLTFQDWLGEQVR
ncbi:NmrA/HSCARG family protein [Spongiactinospora sp. TRM90649]|uniref:NmrA/HSCARG family protein n=1 Tax=Spongiactinospora sp. TRM90649 TaxID=3031114 RepID=UPI0023F6674B|nr:NmrA/HSCARG family protein [Spongiactinospora sp. TRM90649]MDF5756883.1 NmrA/HSCARG family protein [Spongiactinospora sp. TRM90649]